MAVTRALLTETEREQLAGDHGKDRQYQATSRVRARIREELPEDMAVLREHRPELLAELYRSLGFSFQCPRCDASFDAPRKVHEHAYGRDDEHHDDYERHEAPEWWPDDER